MSRVRRAVIGTMVAVMASAGGGVADAAPARSEESTVAGHRNVPEVLRVPEGNRRIAVMPARGVQTYQCTAGAWTFVQPDAILRHHGRAEVLHTRGPVWTSVVDGSSVTAAAQATSPVENAIPQLLLKSTGNRGPGLLGAVTYIQRLNTTGGLSPTGACTDGATASVPYTADYTFWTAAND
jgi:hypothetical protein